MKKQPLLQAMPPAQRFRLVGEVASLMLLSPVHRKYLVNDIGTQILPAIDRGQFRIYHKQDKPMGFVTWAWLSEEAEAKHKAGQYMLKESDWESGDRLWFLDMIAPFGDMPRIVRDLKKHRTQLFGDATQAHALRVDAFGNVRRIQTFFG